jgi:hypothetical protein
MWRTANQFLHQPLSGAIQFPPALGLLLLKHLLVDSGDTLHREISFPPYD